MSTVPKSHFVASVTGARRGAGKGKNFDLFVWTDHFIHRGNFQRPIERARADHSVGFTDIEQDRAVFAFLAAVLVCHQRRFDAVALTGAHGQHHIDEGVTPADPGDEYAVGAHGFNGYNGYVYDGGRVINYGTVVCVGAR